MDFAGLSKPLTQNALDQAGAIVEIPNAALWAVIHVESSGAGYLPDRRPAILFERHKFHSATGGRFDRDHPGISHPRAGGYGAAGAHQYDRLAEALALDRKAALASTSWGLGQVLGSNFAVAGFSDVEDMVTKMVHSERHQLLGMFNFIDGKGLGRHLRSRNWLKFALGYNGRGAETNGYPHKLERAFAAFDNGTPPNIRVRIAQLALTFLGHRPGGVDGIFGDNTRHALQRFQTAAGMPQTSVLTDADFNALVSRAFAGSLDD
jgi:N-acetylmuramidase-like protein/putative peptidoglycan binding protein